MNPVIFGLTGTTLSAAEASFFKEADPAGIILFGRNVDNPEQLKHLVGSLKECLGRDHVAILIDQEGGAVQRMSAPHWRKAPPMALFGKIFAKDPKLAKRALLLNAQLLGADLAAVGITVDCLPVLDVPIKGADAIIGDRAFSDDPKVVAMLGAVVVAGLADAGVLSVIKHIPGHGRAPVDSHKAMPFVQTPRKVLKKTDFPPFKTLNDVPFAMTAHVVYEDIDRDHPATFSKIVVADVIRGDIGFKNLLMSDDICMRALFGSFKARAEWTLKAGVDLVLHCSGTLNEMVDVMRGVTPLAKGKQRFLEAALKKAKREATPDSIGDRACWNRVEREFQKYLA